MEAGLGWLSRQFDLDQRVSLDLGGFFHTFLPPVGLYYATNVLAILGPKTFIYRLALLPITFLVAYRTAVSLDIARGFLPAAPDKLAYMNQALVLAMFTVLTRTLSRTFSSQVPQRIRGTTPQHTRRQIALDAADLTFNLRGVGWNFSAVNKLKLPPYTRPLAPTSAFLIPTFFSLVAHIIMADFMQYACQLFGPNTVGSTAGGSIYDMTTNPSIRYLRSTTLTLLVGLIIYGAIQIGHDAFSIIAVTLLGQSPAEWPPIFQSPWLSTSLTEFWAIRWHQVFRQDFLDVGARPVYLVAGRAGGVLGAFLVSGTLHYVGLWAMGTGSDIRVVLFFLTMGVGVILEGLWRHFVGKRVGGWRGWIWTGVWLLAFGPLMVDPWCRSGIMGSVFIPQAARPSILLHSLVTDILRSAKTYWIEYMYIDRE
ncbi:membrane bound O-acyl transferase family-domain-containing protein [Mycena rosella]|uniref:Membrane bound O-acyl transferase family-domain-containing protein n=1 Tax=Mycena rosella TaxID=1033263 RepID=A0AAD7CRV2_MYCRO|nr:membrane bound O-acyl transferase family-domain-containing protein [Mycena rosella]